MRKVGKGHRGAWASWPAGSGDCPARLSRRLGGAGRSRAAGRATPPQSPLHVCCSGTEASRRPAGPARGLGPSPLTPAARSHRRDGRKSGGDTRRGLRPPDMRTAACGALLPPAGPADSRQHPDRPPPAFQTAGEEAPVILSHQVMTICCGHPRKLVQGDTNF